MRIFKRKKLVRNSVSLSQIKIVRAHSETRAMSPQEVEEFLREGRKIMKIATLTEKNEPYITPVWYLYKDGKLFLMADKNSKKIKNIKRNSKMSFCIDRDSVPYRGVRGISKAMIVSDPNKAVKVRTEIIIKYLGNLKNPWAQRYLEEGRKGNSVVVEIEPEVLVTWT